jgi:hypothetical protein
MAHDPISTAYFINPTRQSVCTCIPPIVARQRLGKNVTARKKYTDNNRRIVGYVIFYAVRVVSEGSKRLVLPRTSCFKSCNANALSQRSDLRFSGEMFMVISFIERRLLLTNPRISHRHESGYFSAVFRRTARISMERKLNTEQRVILCYI